MVELYLMIMKMILESYGLERLYEGLVENYSSIFRVMKYKSSSSNSDINHDNGESQSGKTWGGGGGEVALPAHTDKNGITILCQNEVQGLQIQTRDGDFAQVDVPTHVFTVIVGDAVKAWSNGRLRAARHRVVIKGDKERYCFGLFSTPKEDAIIEVPPELAHPDPLLYRPFRFSDYVSYFVKNPTDDALEIYAGAAVDVL